MIATEISTGQLVGALVAVAWASAALGLLVGAICCARSKEARRQDVGHRCLANHIHHTTEGTKR